MAKSTPDDLLKRIEKDIVDVLNTADVREKLRTVGVIPLGDGSSAMSSLVARETEMWRDVVSRAANLSLSQTLSGWQLIENRAILLRDEGSLQTYWLDGHRSVPVAGDA